MRAVIAIGLLLALAPAQAQVQAPVATMPAVPAVRMVAPAAMDVSQPVRPLPARAARDPGDSQAQDTQIDRTLERFAEANAGNPQVAAALDAAADEVAANPAAYIQADGSPDQSALQGVVGRHFSVAGAVSVPSPAGGDASYPSLGAMGDGDIMALAFIVMMDAARSAREDLKAIMEDAKAINAKKAAQRDAVREGKQAAQDASDATLDAAQDADQDDEDTLSDLSEKLRQRIQMLMDRYSKFMEALSNILRKNSDTSDEILGNMK